MTRMLTYAELMALSEPPARVTVQFIRPGEPRPDGRGTFRVNERIDVPPDVATHLQNSGAAAIVGKK